MDLYPIQDFVETNTSLTIGVDLFVFSIPHGIDKGVLLTREVSETRVDHEIPGRSQSRFQVIVRDPDHETGKALAYELYWLLWIREFTDWTDFCTNYIRPRHEPVAFRRSDGDVIEWSINYETDFFRDPGLEFAG